MSYNNSRRDVWNDDDTWYDKEYGFLEKVMDKFDWGHDSKTEAKYDALFALSQLLYLLGVEPRS